jgi:hypothetical protein
MDILFNGVGVDCNRQELEASLVCPNLANEKSLTMVNSTYFTVSLFGKVSEIKITKNVKIFHS